MNDDIFNFRFAICDRAQPVHDAAWRLDPLLLTPRFSGVWESQRSQNRFSGFNRHSQTAEAVQVLGSHNHAEGGANERDYSNASFQPPFANRKFKIP